MHYAHSQGTNRGSKKEYYTRWSCTKKYMPFSMPLSIFCKLLLLLEQMSRRSQGRHYQSSSRFKYQADLTDNTVPYWPSAVHSTPLQPITIFNLVACLWIIHLRLSAEFTLEFYFSPLKTKSRLLYLKTQSVPRSKHFSSGL